MKNDYPDSNTKKVKNDYTDIINDTFKENNLNWTAYPAKVDPKIFIGPKGDRMLFEFPNVYKIGIYTEKGVARLEIKGMLSMKTSLSKDILESKGYKYSVYSERSNLCEFIKPLENLEAVVEELKDIKRILLYE